MPSRMFSRKSHVFVVDGTWKLKGIRLDATERVVDEEKLRGGVRFTGRIPRNDLGKIVRHDLMKLLPNKLDI